MTSLVDEHSPPCSLPQLVESLNRVNAMLISVAQQRIDERRTEEWNAKFVMSLEGIYKVKQSSYRIRFAKGMPRGNWVRIRLPRHSDPKEVEKILLGGNCEFRFVSRRTVLVTGEDSELKKNKSGGMSCEKTCYNWLWKHSEKGRRDWCICG